MPTIHPLPVNPTTGQQPLAALRSGSGAIGSAPNSSSGVNRQVLKGLQDVAWSDEEDDPDCMVCAEPLDLSDQRFKPCQCGLQICQFCYHKLLADDPRCPGCRRTYDIQSIEFQPPDAEEMRRAKEKKAKRQAVTKNLEKVGRRHLLDTRIVMKNSVYVVGMKIPGSGSTEEAVSILRSNEFFGQYGKIARLYLRDRTEISSPVAGPAPDSPSTSTGIYIVYVRREDAARAIASLDGIPAPQGQPGQLLHASYGAARYCDQFLQGRKCDNPQCQNLHEWGGEGDCFTRTDLITALTRPAEYDARQKQSQLQPPPLTQKSAWPKPSAEEVDSSALPRTANWGMRPAPARPGSSSSGRVLPVGSSRPTKISSTLIPLGRSSAAFPPPQPSPVPTHKEKKERKALGMARGRSESSSVGTAPPSAQTSPKKKPITVTLSSSSIALAPPTPTTKTAPPPPPGLAPPVSAPASASTSAPASASATSPAPSEPADSPAPEEKPRTPKKKVDVVKVEPEPEPEQPEAGPSRPPTPPQPKPQTEYPIHSPYPDFDDIFLEPEARKEAFEFSLALDDDELARLLALAQEVGGFEPSPFDPLLEELPKLGIPLASLIAAPRYDERGPIVYTGPFSPFSPSSPVETSSLPTTDEPSGSNASSDDVAPRTTSRFEFARRGSLASTRAQSPFRGREDWGRAPSSNGYPEDLRPSAATVPPHLQPALAQLNSHSLHASLHAHSPLSPHGMPHAHQHSQAQPPHHAHERPQPHDNWSAAGSDYAPTYRGFGGSYGTANGYGNGNGNGYGSPQQARDVYSPVTNGPPIPPGYEYPPPNYQQMGFVQRRF